MRWKSDQDITLTFPQNLEKFHFLCIVGREKNETYEFKQHRGVKIAILHKNLELFCFTNLFTY